jgi:hypothetical protein
MVDLMSVRRESRQFAQDETLTCVFRLRWESGGSIHDHA